MKKLVLFFIVGLLFGSCAKQGSNDELSDPWRGYSNHLKQLGIHSLIAARHDTIGTVNYSMEMVDGVPSFVVTYQTNTGYTMSETHNFAGLKAKQIPGKSYPIMPLNKPGSPKIGQFYNSNTYSTWVNTKTYVMPLTSLPTQEEGGFVVASHAIVHGPNNYTETAWAWSPGSTKFTDKDWGWYDDVTYWIIPHYTVLYGTSYSNNMLNVYHINVTTNTSEIMLSEYVGNSNGTYDGAAYNPATDMFYFTKNQTELWKNDLSIPNDASQYIGDLMGAASSGTIYNNEYYYINATSNTINKVTFTETGFTDVELDAIPSALNISDIAMGPSGDYLYMVGTQTINGIEEVKLLSWQVSTGNFFSQTITPAINPGVQIAFGADGTLYAIAPTMNGALAYTLDQYSGSATPVDEDVIIIGEGMMITDLSTGPSM